MKRGAQVFETRLRQGLVAAIAVMGVLLAADLLRPVTPPNQRAVVVPQKNHESTRQEQQLRRPSDPEAFAVITERPLFSPGRRPPAADASSETTAATAARRPDDLLLSAVIITQDQRLAVVQFGRKTGMQRIALGETAEGWTLTDVQPEAVELTRDGEVRRLELEMRPSGPATGAGDRGSAKQAAAPGTGSGAPSDPEEELEGDRPRQPIEEAREDARPP